MNEDLSLLKEFRPAKKTTEEKQKKRNLSCLHRFLHGESLVVLMNGGPDDRDYSETGEGGQAVYRNVVSSSLQHDNQLDRAG